MLYASDSSHSNLDRTTEEAKKTLNAWVSETEQIIYDSFADPNNDMVNEFEKSASNAYGYRIPSQQYSLQYEADEFKKILAAYIQGINSFIADAKMSSAPEQLAPC